MAEPENAQEAIGSDPPATMPGQSDPNRLFKFRLIGDAAICETAHLLAVAYSAWRSIDSTPFPAASLRFQPRKISAVTVHLNTSSG
jgi:hypothetical protein